VAVSDETGGDRHFSLYFGGLVMSFTGDYACDRCKKVITGNSVIVSFESQTGLTHFKDGLDLCSDCFSAFVDWVTHSETDKMGSVERVARQEDSKELGPVERVARREDSK
jgi:hypothetical protein